MWVAGRITEGGVLGVMAVRGDPRFICPKEHADRDRDGESKPAKSICEIRIAATEREEARENQNAGGADPANEKPRADAFVIVSFRHCAHIAKATRWRLWNSPLQELIEGKCEPSAIATIIVVIYESMIACTRCATRKV